MSRVGDRLRGNAVPPTRAVRKTAARKTTTSGIACDDAGARLIVKNDAGWWSIWKEFTRDGPATVGPGYIGRLRAASGALVVDDFYDRSDPEHTWGTINDPQNGGLGCFGFHVARRNGQPDPVNYTWDVTGRHEASSRGGYGVSASRMVAAPKRSGDGANERIDISFEVDLTDGEAAHNGVPLATVRYDYSFQRRLVTCAVAVTTGQGAHVGTPAFLKEPKLVCHALSATEAASPCYRNLEIMDRSRDAVAQVDIWSLPSPMRRTQQIGHDRRARLRFLDPKRPDLPFEVGAEALADDGGRTPWDGAKCGFDRWAVLSNKRERLEPCEHDEDYCLQGPPKGTTLTRQWEVARWASRGRNSKPPEDKPQVGVMLHAWEGGSGYPDCRCCYRRFGAAGETFRVFLSYLLGEGV
jgi:hypothetical protein